MTLLIQFAYQNICKFVEISLEKLEEAIDAG